MDFTTNSENCLNNHFEICYDNFTITFTQSTNYS